MPKKHIEINEDYYLSLYEIIVGSDLRISSPEDLKSRFPNEYHKKEFLEFMGRKLYFEGFESKAKLFLLEIGEEISGHDLYILSVIFFYSEEYSEAESYFKLALNLGYTRSYYWLGYITENGLGQCSDKQKAIEYYRSGAACGYLMPHRSYLRLKHDESNLLGESIYRLKFFFLIVKASILVIKNINDERLADIPNYFEKK